MSEPRLPSVYNLISLERCASTNDEARDLARQGEVAAPDGTLVWAREQTKGRGRRGRDWVSPPGNLHLSLILRPEVPLREAAQLSFVTAVALYDALGNISEPGHQIHLKWPNDVLLQEKKVAGILLESEAGGAEFPEWVIVGLGVNVAHFPDDAAYPATSLSAEHWTVTVEDTLVAFARSFQRWANIWVEEGFDKVRRTWLNRAIGKGKAIEVRLENETLTGNFKDLDDDGALILEDDGAERRIAAGVVYFPDN